MEKDLKIPEGWKIVKLGDLCMKKEGLRRGPFGSAIKKEFFVPDGYKVYEQSNAIYNDVERGKYFINASKYQELINFKIEPGDLIVSCSGTLGKIAEIPLNAKPGVINQALLRIRLLDNVISKKFFLFYFRSSFFQGKIFDQSQGTAMSNLIGIKDFKEIELLLPPLPTQHLIVAKIEALFSQLDHGIAQLKTAQAQLKVYRQAVLKWAFEGKLTNKDVQEGELPEGWKWVKLGEAAEMCLGKMLDKAKNKGAFQPYLRNVNVRWGAFDLSDLLEMRFEPHEEQRYGLKEGDIVICEGGEPGRAAVWREKNSKMKIQKALHRVRFNGNHDSFYFYYYLSHAAGSKLLEKYFTGTTIKHFTGQSLKRFEFPAPTLAEQHLIVQEIESRLSVCDKIEEIINAGLQQAEALRQSILKRAFEGKLVGPDIL